MAHKTDVELISIRTNHYRVKARRQNELDRMYIEQQGYCGVH